MTEEVKETAPVETIGDYVAGLEVSYRTLSQKHIEIAEEESGRGEKWTQFAQMVEDRATVKIRIVEAMKGGVVTSLEEVRTFIPASQPSTKYVGELENWQGKYVETVTTTVDPERKRLVLSGREVEKEEKEAQKKKRMAQFKTGNIVEGTVGSIEPYGVFIKLDDSVGELLHVSQISTQRIKHPSAVLTEEQTVKVRILSTQEDKLSLSMKVLAEQQTDREEHETFDYRETSAVSTGSGNLLKGLKLQT